MSIQLSETPAEKMVLTSTARLILLITAIVAALGPNLLYLYTLFTQPELNQQALRNPIAQAFMFEAMMLLVLFLWYVYRRTHSWAQVVIYLVLAFLGSLAFSFPIYLYVNSRNG